MISCIYLSDLISNSLYNVTYRLTAITLSHFVVIRLFVCMATQGTTKFFEILKTNSLSCDVISRSYFAFVIYLQSLYPFVKPTELLRNETK